MLRQIPNLLTLLRIFLVIPFALYFLQGRYDLALLLFAIAGVSDGVDGFVAR
ncbi:CDP-alcohol phosphatidyltransferase family protein, partial [Oleiphilus sp. HI0067]